MSESQGLLDSEKTPLPKKQVFFLVLIIFCDIVREYATAPFIPLLVVLYFDDEDVQGTYSGILTSAFWLAQMISSPFWGRLSDIIGRKPVFIMGMCGALIGLSVFSLGSTFWTVYLGRFLVGLLVGTTVIGKTYMGEITDKTNAHSGFAVIGVSLGIAAMIAPTVGGYLFDPYSWDNVKYDTEWWSMHPYWLTCQVMYVMYVCCILTTIIFLPETLKNPKALFKNNDDLTSINSLNGEGDESSRVAYNSIDPGPINAEIVYTEEELIDQAIAEGKMIFKDQYLEYPYEWLKRYIPKDVMHRPTARCISLFAFNACLSISYDTLYPLLLELSLGLSSETVGTFISYYGLSTIAYQGFIYVPLAERLGSKWMCVGSYGIFIVMFAIMPLLEFFEEDDLTGIYVTIFLVGVLRAMCASTGALSLQVMITQTTPQGSLGLVNGFSNGLNAAGKSIMPLVAGALWSVGTGTFWGACIAYWSVGLFGFLPLALAFTLPEELNFKIARVKKGE